MNVNQEYFLELISSELAGKAPSVRDDVEWIEICRLSKIHNLIAVVFSSMNRLPAGSRPPKEIFDRMKKEFLLCVHHNNAIDNYTKKIILNMNQNKIEHILIKGYILKDYYPTAEYRSMSDVDILIKKEERERAHEVMLSLGYKNHIRDKNVWNYRKKSSFIELHTELIDEEIREDAELGEYFSKAWSHRESLDKEGYSYTLEKSYHLIYLFAHMAKHFYNCGCGVRMIMDIAVFIDKFKEELDLDYIFEELAKIKLDLFAQNIMILCNMWFGTKVNFSYELEPEFYEELSSTILEGGTFGFNTSNFRLARLRNEVDENSYERTVAKTLKNMVFSPYEEMIKLSEYAFLKDRRHLIVIAWVYRWFYQIKSRGFSSIGYVLGVLSSKDEVKKQKETINKLGL